MKELLSGNEAIARGAYEGGVEAAFAYPGTPSTEILENVARHYPDIYAEWAPNEKVSLESAIGSSLCGARTLVAMKHVGLNVAADPLFSLSYMGVNGGVMGGRVCWAISGTFCGMQVEGSEAVRFISCFVCDFFTQVLQEEGLANFKLLKPGQTFTQT